MRIVSGASIRYEDPVRSPVLPSPMKRVLILAYYFPPLGGAGVQRTVKFLKHLPDLGYVAVVVTGPESGAVGWAPTDRTLEREISADHAVVRATEGPPSGNRPRFARWLGLPSPFERWWLREATRLGRGAMRDVDLVYASMSPFGTALVARTLARETGKPWVADLRDPWALDEWTVYPTALHRARDRIRMRRALREADAVVMNTDEAARALVREFPEFGAAHVVTIPNGWDRNDFSAHVTPRTDDRFRVVYTGYSHVARRRHRVRGALRAVLGGSDSKRDVLTRSHVFLVEALARLHNLDLDLARRAELHVAGAAPPAVGLETAGVEVHHHGYLPHDEAVALMRSADVLFLPMHDVQPGRRVRTVPGKTYEYLASGRPILAALPEGDARDLLSGLPNVWLCRPSDVDAMTRALLEIDRDRNIPSPPSEFVERFERRRQAETLARVFDDVLSASATR